ncbi:MAG TPA: DUF3108 domain-containing protein [Longimicrobiaceae bacterium]|nr:DUF3108 domain-containing protein [Longimicrobiaceae bacterium]
MPFRLPRARALAALAAVLALAGAADARAPAAQQDTAEAAPAHPFGPGERAVFQVKLGAVAVGTGSMHVMGIENVHGQPTYHTRLRLSGGIPLARVDDRFDSWIDVKGLFSRRFKQDQKEVRFERKRTYEFYPERREYRRLDNGETGSIPTDRPLDDVSFLYYARTLPLRVGETYTLHQYFKADGNPVILKVVRRDTVRVPAGTFPTIVIRPVIKTDGLFGEGGEAEVHFSDDARRIPVQIRSKVPLIGSLTMSLREYQPGK